MAHWRVLVAQARITQRLDLISSRALDAVEQQSQMALLARATSAWRHVTQRRAVGDMHREYEELRAAHTKQRKCSELVFARLVASDAASSVQAWTETPQPGTTSVVCLDAHVAVARVECT